MIVWIHNSELDHTVVLGDTTYAPSDTTVVEVQSTPEPAPAPTKKG